MDDVDFGNIIMEALGLPPNENSSSEEKVGEARLGSGSIGKSFGATLLLGTLIFVIIVLIVILVIYIAKRVKLSEKTKERIKGLKTKVFWNPIVRYLVLNSLKLSMTALVVFKASDSGPGDYIVSIVLLLVLNLAPIAFFKALDRNKETLSSPETLKSIGSIYTGKNITKEEGIKAYMFPMAFFWRRTLFVVVTVFLFDWPAMQAIAH